MLWTAARQASCPSPSPRACSNSCPLSQWCHPTVSSCVVPFFSCLQSCPASGSFLMSQLFTLGGKGIGASVSASVLLMNIQDWFILGLSGLSPLQSKGLSRVFSNTIVQKHQFFSVQASLGFPHSLVSKESACNAGDPGSIPGFGRFPVEGNGNPLQYYCLENPMDRGAWQATVHGIARVGHDLAT